MYTIVRRYSRPGNRRRVVPSLSILLVLFLNARRFSPWALLTKADAATPLLPGGGARTSLTCDWRCCDEAPRPRGQCGPQPRAVFAASTPACHTADVPGSASAESGNLARILCKLCTSRSHPLEAGFAPLRFTVPLSTRSRTPRLACLRSVSSLPEASHVRRKLRLGKGAAPWVMATFLGTNGRAPCGWE